MHESINWLNNPWIVGIITGIITGILSGLIVYYILNTFFQKPKDKEYLQKIFTANQEILYSIRPAIAEDKVPGSETIKTLVAATARRYAIKSEDMYGPVEILQDLTKQVMDSSFISSQTKQEYCNRLTSIIPKVSNEVFVSNVANIEFRIDAQRQQDKITKMMGVLMGVSSGLMAIIFSLINHNVVTIFKETSLLIPLGTSLIGVLAVFLLFYLKKLKILNEIKNENSIKKYFTKEFS